MNSVDKTFDDKEYDDDDMFTSFNDNPYDTFDRAFDDSNAFNDDNDSLFYSEPRPKPSSVYDLYDLTHVNPVMKRRISTLQEAVETRQAASSEQKQLAEELKKRELPNNHTYTKKRCTINCIKCARNLNELYTSNGSNIYFAMVDPRWPRSICKHLKPDYKCVSCNGSSICEHNKERYTCQKCGNGICRKPEHAQYIVVKPLRKSVCPGCKEDRKKNTKKTKKKGGLKQKKSYKNKKKYMK